MNVLPYRKPKLGRDYWVADDFLPNALDVARRCLEKTEWSLGFPHRPENWPGMRSSHALLPDELDQVERFVKEATGKTELWQPSTQGATLSHNHVQVVGAKEAIARPHVDSLELCSYAGVLYLQPKPPTPSAGTSFYRLRLPDGRLGGNLCPPPHRYLSDALGVQKLPPTAFVPEVSVDYVFNRLLIYRSDLIHSATSYFGDSFRERRMTALFFWQAA